MPSELPTGPSELPASPTLPSNTLAGPVPGSLRAALERRGFTDLTTVQEAVGAAADDGVDLQISSQTGSGKTVAIGMLLVQRLFEGDAADPSVGKQAVGKQPPSALVITPTRELAAQVQKELAWLYADVPAATVVVVTGGTSVGLEVRALRRGPSIVVGTPGRMLDHMRSGVLDCTQVREVVLDEADQMLDMGFREELEGILDGTPPERGTHLVSATFPRAIQRLAERYQSSPRHVEGTRLGEANADIENVVHLVFGQDRYAALVNLLLLAQHQRTLVFVNTRADTAELSGRLSEDGLAAMPLSGELPQTQRTRTLSAFKDGVVNVLVATDVAARGLDIPEVDTVIQAGTPMDAESYVHRAGRTGRAGRKGRNVLLVPTSNERRIRGLLAQSGVEASWCDIPSASRVQKKLVKRGRRRLLQAIDATEAAGEAELEYARLLLEGRDPARVVAALVAHAAPRPLREPMDIDAPRPRGAEQGGRGDRGARRPTRSFERRGDAGRGGPGGGGPGAGGPGAGGPGAGGYGGPGRGDRGQRRTLDGEHVRFSINWGFKGGANPRRLMAMICRRGDVTGRVVGTIQTGPTSTVFEIQRDAAAHFETKAKRPDARDPRLWIRRV